MYLSVNFHHFLKSFSDCPVHHKNVQGILRYSEVSLHEEQYLSRGAIGKDYTNIHVSGNEERKQSYKV